MLVLNSYRLSKKNQIATQKPASEATESLQGPLHLLISIGNF